MPFPCTKKAAYSPMISLDKGEVGLIQPNNSGGTTTLHGGASGRLRPLHAAPDLCVQYPSALRTRPLFYRQSTAARTRCSATLNRPTEISTDVHSNRPVLIEVKTVSPRCADEKRLTND